MIGLYRAPFDVTHDTMSDFYAVRMATVHVVYHFEVHGVTR